MKALPAFLILMAIASPAFAASDCEHTCCDKFSGGWDDDFDDCKHYKDGFEACVSDCEGAIWAAQQHPDLGEGGTHYECKAGFILLAALSGAAILSGREKA